MPFVDLAREQIQMDAADAVPLHILRRLKAVPFRLEGDQLKVAIVDPADIGVIDELRLATSHGVSVAVASQHDIELALRRLVRGSEFAVRAALTDDDEVAEVQEPELDEEGGDETAPARLVNSILVQAAEDGASDVHFLPRADGLVIRVRIDGVVHEIDRIARSQAPGVVARVKVLAKLDIAEHRKPQDGRISMKTKRTRQQLDIRVAVLPTVEGEGVIMRLHDKSRRAPTLTEIGLSNAMQMELEEVISTPTGALLVTGPTGSGKSTTVYAALADLIRPEINVISVEDPVEYRLEDVYQIQVDSRAGLTFANALRAILRSDPDVLVVGEIRDLETAKISVEAALTGHFMFSTLHTNDAPSAITRLTEMGVEPYLTASAISAVVSQRLVRRLCLECREEYRPSAEELAAVRLDVSGDDDVTFYRKRGCTHCYKGYRGRVGVYQLMVMNEELRELAAARATREQLERAAFSAGMGRIWDDGVEKVAAGLTTTEELHRMLR